MGLLDRTSLSNATESLNRTNLFGRVNLSPLDSDAALFINRVLADGGTVEDVGFLNDFIANAKANNYFNDIIAAYSPSWGVKGGATASDLYSVTGATWDLAQATAAAQPAINLADLNGKTRIETDGVDDCLGPQLFTLNQPETIILGGVEQLSWTVDRRFIDGGTNATGSLYQSQTSPNIRTFAGLVTAENTNLSLNTPKSIRVLFNGASSESQIGSTAIVSADAGALNMGGFTFGAGAGGTAFSNISAGIIVILNAAIDGSYTAKTDAIRNFINAAYGTS